MRKSAVAPGQLLFEFAIQGAVTVRYSRELTIEERTDAYRDHLPRMPHTDEECIAVGLGWAKPCPHFRCRYHLGIDVKNEVITAYRADADLRDYPATCSLAVARHGPKTDTQIVAITGMSLRTIERDTASAMAKIRAAGLGYLLKE